MFFPNLPQLSKWYHQTSSCSNPAPRGFLDFLLGLTPLQLLSALYLQSIPWICPLLSISTAKNPIQATTVSNLDNYNSLMTFYFHSGPFTIYLPVKVTFKYVNHTVSLHFSKLSHGLPTQLEQNRLQACLPVQPPALKSPSSQATLLIKMTKLIPAWCSLCPEQCTPRSSYGCLLFIMKTSS